MKRVLALMVVFTISFSLVLSGCGTSSSKTELSASTTAQTTTGATTVPANTSGLPIVTEPTTIKVLTHDNYESSASYATTKIAVFDELEKRTGIHMELEVYTGGEDYDTAAQTKLAAGQSLPDLMLMPGGDPMKFAATGLIIPIDELIAKDAPNIQKLYQESPSYKAPLICPDGKQYTLATFMDCAPTNMPSIMIRKDWLTKLGLSMPQTLDDWTAVLTAFKEKDPNGNGKSDEIPLCTLDSPFYMLEYFSSAYGLHMLDSVNWNYFGWYLDANGKIQSDWENPATKDWLTLANQWYKAKLLDPEMLTQDGDKWRAKLLDNKAGTTCTYSLNAPMWTEQMQTKYPGAEWRNVQPPKGPAGDGFYAIGTGFLSDHQYAITKDCKNPDVVMKWLDYLYASEEGSRLISWGIEGEDYTMVNGEPQFTDAILKNEKGSGTALWSRGVGPNLPYILPKTHLSQRFSQYTDAMSDMAEISKFTKPALIFGLAKEDESKTYNNIVPNMKTYMQEMVAKFIIGKEPLSKYDEFVAKMKSMGLADAIAIKQAQYDRANVK